MTKRELEEILRAGSVEAGGCWIWQKSTRGSGYAQRRFRLFGQVVALVSRAVVTVRVGRPLRRDEVAMHTCDTPLCVNPRHIRKGTMRANVQDMWRKGRACPPPGGPRKVKLSEEQVREIRRALPGRRQVDVAKQFGAAQSVISRIVRGVYPHGGK